MFQRYLTAVLLVICTSIYVYGQDKITGIIVDADDNYGIPYASVSYKGHHVAVSCDGEGRFTIDLHKGWVLTFSAIGYESQVVAVDENKSDLKISLKSETKKLQEVVIQSRRGRYTRKNNPAVELMRRVIAAKKQTHLENHDFYSYNRYQKITFGMNDLHSDDLEKGIFKRSPWLVDHVEQSSYNNKLILPLTVTETVSQHIYRKNPKTEKEIIKGQQNEGLTNVIQTGEILTEVLKDVFTDVDIYDNYIRLLQYPFPSPIGETAISFYRYYIVDTVYVDRDLCYHLQFLPNNQQDFGFRGDLYVLTDSTLHVKRCDLTIPKKSDVNFVENMKVEQVYTKLPNGEWALTTDNMMAELKLNKLFSKAICMRTTRLSDYSFDELPRKLFNGRAKVKREIEAMNRDKAFWSKYRTVELTKAESSMDNFMHRMEQSKNYKWIITGVKALLENYVETTADKDKNKFDIGPVNTLISSNFADGMRLRASGRTTAHLNPHLFWTGFYAYGMRSHKSYYSSEVTYSFNKKQLAPFEFPQNSISFETTYDVMSPTDKFLLHNKDNIFMSIRALKIRQLYFYNRQHLKFSYESPWGLRIGGGIKAESNEPTGDLAFYELATGNRVQKIRTTELNVSLKYQPGVTYINTKQKRVPINLDAPEFGLTHTMGLKGFLGGQYKYNLTQLSVYKRQWLGSWGSIDTHIKAGAQWNRVPFPLLIMPPVNPTYIENEETFSLMNNMEFLTDRYAFWSVTWDMNGKLLNRVPLIKHLKWREYIAFKGMFGSLTDKNNPFLSQNALNTTMFQFPSGSYLMNSRTPYMEFVAGVHNIFKFFGVLYVHRFNYDNHANISRNGVRFSFMFSF
ncbi:MAG: carboxypeptidase-like regulatory domain-containing protein [Prevotellaceae bacterium]|nr:carboxypeptidase-like regulatory domain-containing protein [Prevotellaceae bacterium]